MLASYNGVATSYLTLVKKLPELEAVLALCKAAPFVQSSTIAEQLLHQLAPYLPESYAQILSPSPTLRDIGSSPYETLTENLTSAILSLGVRHERLQSPVRDIIIQYMKGWSSAAAELSADHFDQDDQTDFAADGDLAKVMTQSLSLLGFLNATAAHANFWSAYDRLRFVESLRSALSENFLIAFETALSVVRNARSHHHGLREWKRYAKHYAALGRPLGAMILHDSFLQVVVACAALLVDASHRDPKDDILDSLRASYNSNRILKNTSEDALADGLARIATEEMDRLDNDLDYLQRVGSAWQQRQASSVKAKVIITYLCCTVYDDDIAESDMLMSWLDSTLNDPAQSIDHDLSCTVLKSMAILAKVLPAMASTLGRSLPRVIVQGGFDHRTASVAADCLASVLSVLPQDAIITTLYSLGNVIGTGPVDRASASSPALNGQGKALRASGIYSTQHTGSAISLTPSDFDEPHHVHTTVVQTIISVASNCKDEKITALALSMLTQKVGRVSRTVDAKIITDAAILGVQSASGEFRALLKLYTKLCHDAIVADDQMQLEAVSFHGFHHCITLLTLAIGQKRSPSSGKRDRCWFTCI
jgi:phosphatidylinositol 4-kinase